MSDTSTNKFNAQGDNAARAAFTPSPGTPTPTPAQGYTFWDTDDQVLYAWETGTGWVATSGGNVNAAATLTQYAVVLGDGSSDVSVVAGLGSSGDVLTSNGAGAAPTFQPPTGGGGGAANATINGRITTETGVPISTSDRTAQATIYFTPYNGNQIGLYTGVAWSVLTFSELSLALSGLTSGKNYDVFVDYNSGTPQLVLSAAWTNDTTRADALALQDGIYVKSGTTTYRWAGTIRTTATTTTEDSAAKRFVWNAYNRVSRPLVFSETTSHTYNSSTWRYWNNSSANRAEFVAGVAGEATQTGFVATLFTNASNTTAASASAMLNWTSGTPTLWVQSNIAIFALVGSASVGTNGLGFNYVAALEAETSGTGTFSRIAIQGTVSS